EASSAVAMATLGEFDAVVEVAGWDEAFLAADTDDPEALARQIQDRVRAVTNLDCTVGIGENKLQAKLAAGFGKPAGIFRLTHQSWYAVLGDRPTDALWGDGAKTARRLAGVGIHAVVGLAGTDPRYLYAHLGPLTPATAGRGQPSACSRSCRRRTSRTWAPSASSLVSSPYSAAWSGMTP